MHWHECHMNTDSDPNCDSVCNCDVHRNHDSDRDPNADADRSRNSDCYCDTDCHHQGYADRDADDYRNCNDSNCDHRRDAYCDGELRMP